ncbi:uncharacterized protein LOC128181697 isoform X1 [Crassostrea angulata]|uniref:uncharacterized protein LOC128181697 isoform X1 n=1 Tax=Magallana angulata TaxID=2784310 RepID=UPI0022B14419|nr:uncharacterized protein LOC128181697 isoform X1 [Crassostrea angulata]
MFSKVQIWLSLGLIVVQTFQAVSFLGSSFKFLSDMDNIRFDQFIIRSLTTRSPLDCSRKCEIHGTCLSFQYSHMSGQCRLFNTIFLHQDAGVHDIGWQYYIASNRGCRDPFIDGRDLDICFMFAGFNNLTEGMKECAAIQSNVISITSTEENDFLTRLTGTLSNVSPLNVSYKRPFIQGFWNGTAWILENGTPLVYTNWAKGHPQIDDEKRYIRSIKGKWQSTKSSAIRSIFCSYKP